MISVSATCPRSTVAAGRDVVAPAVVGAAVIGAAVVGALGAIVGAAGGQQRDADDRGGRSHRDHSDRRKARRLARARGAVSAWKRACGVGRLAAVPEDGLGRGCGRGRRAGRRCGRSRVSVRPMPHSGGVRHSAPVASPSGRSSARPAPMSCSSRSVYGRMVWCASAGDVGWHRCVSCWQRGTTRSRPPRTARAAGVGGRSRRRRGAPARRACACRRDTRSSLARRPPGRRRSAAAVHARWPAVQSCVGKQRRT